MRTAANGCCRGDDLVYILLIKVQDIWERRKYRTYNTISPKLLPSDILIYTVYFLYIMSILMRECVDNGPVTKSLPQGFKLLVFKNDCICFCAIKWTRYPSWAWWALARAIGISSTYTEKYLRTWKSSILVKCLFTSFRERNCNCKCIDSLFSWKLLRERGCRYGCRNWCRSKSSYDSKSHGIKRENESAVCSLDIESSEGCVASIEKNSDGESPSGTSAKTFKSFTATPLPSETWWTEPSPWPTTQQTSCLVTSTVLSMELATGAADHWVGIDPNFRPQTE